MSYILEALKKSEKERQREEIPDLQADHSLPIGKRQESKPPLLYLFAIVVLLLGAAGVLLWYQFSGDRIPQLTADSKVTPAPSPAVQAPEQVVPAITEQPVERSSEVKEQVAEEAVSERVADTVTESIPAAASQATGQDVAVIPLLDELSEKVRAGMPDLSFAGHVYADEPVMRLIIINNRIVREGDLVSDGLSLEKIEPNGVVLRYKTAVFRVQLF